MRMKPTTSRNAKPPAAGPPRPAAWRTAVGQDPAARRILESWRRLTTGPRERRAGPGAPTLIACSGGADSSALVLALAVAQSPATSICVAHILHDLRPRREALADREAARKLAKLVGARFLTAQVRIRDARGNPEANARSARYCALLKLAHRHKLSFIATAHHADDQLETLLMALMRGSGPRGLRGVAIRRRLDPGPAATRTSPTFLIRPMVDAHTTRDDSERICRAAGWEWAVDATNADESRLRSAVRHQIVPLMRALRPAAPRHAVETARTMHLAASLLQSRARTIFKLGEVHSRSATWPRARLIPHPPPLLGEFLRLAAEHFSAAKGADRMAARAIAPITRAIRDSSTEPRRFEIGPIRVEVTARVVTIAPRRSR